MICRVEIFLMITQIKLPGHSNRLWTKKNWTLTWKWRKSFLKSIPLMMKWGDAVGEVTWEIGRTMAHLRRSVYNLGMANLGMSNVGMDNLRTSDLGGAHMRLRRLARIIILHRKTTNLRRPKSRLWAVSIVGTENKTLKMSSEKIITIIHIKQENLFFFVYEFLFFFVLYVWQL